MSNNLNQKKFPVLYGNASNNKIKEWSIHVIKESDNAIKVITLNGYIDGKKAKSEKIITEGKNIGKKNETTPFEQAIFESDKKWRNKIEKNGYCESLEALQKGNNLSNVTVSNSKIKSEKIFIEPIYPMLAKKYELYSKTKKKADIVFPCFCQPKLDGLRCMIYLDENNNVKMMSRAGKQFLNLDHIRNEIKIIFKTLPKSIYLDGELYSDEIPFEEINGICKKEKNIDNIKSLFIKYHIFDYYDSNNKKIYFSNRIKLINDLIKKNNFKFIENVLTEEISSKDLVKSFHDKYVSENYEGLMLRNKNSEYKLKNRSNDLQKYKEFLDSEFPIIGMHEGTGEDHGTIIWECEYTDKLGSKKTFSVRPKGSRQHRRDLFLKANNNFKNFNRKLLTVRYQELSEHNCPRFPVGIDIRYDL